MKCDFSYNHYREILKKALTSGFVITNFRDFDRVKNASKIIILRHDVDYSPKRALEIANIEKKLNIQSTFFIRVHGEYYHPFGRINYPFFKEITRIGHEIGLHFESRNLSKIFNIDQIKLFRQEKAILEEIFKTKIQSVSEHGDLDNCNDFWKNHFFTKVNKSKVGIKNFPQDKKYRYFKYISDSCQKWRDGCLCENIDKHSKIQALIHGDLWGKDAIKERNSLLKSNPLLKSDQCNESCKQNINLLLGQ